MRQSGGQNVHATAIVLGTHGFLFVGPSGSGKSSIALACLAAANAQGLFATLIADDQVLISTMNGRVIANRPASIAGLAEIRGSGIVAVDSVEAAVIDYTVLPLQGPIAERLPQKEEVYTLPDGNSLPLYRLPLLPGLRPFDILRLVLPRNVVFER
ncbi:serine kinase of HPr protein (carbohydrate metabolism regulator) [Pararhizobium capsulatum DSM 1112]|uniref:Serine kinase of HPr protein (Carbohydrate metabolism regulator) n=1 Tax=Pararhizobium capsulatum DSM 1112 TaxID=1121113 RepID=A0ABU0BJ18_9HYPH|nr:HPr kinase/phosphorylase [Pararhizobium capsulatum]MDQ0318251.1 serine kinase of HPr protein (carbohydrate metabolism regulator) [Pararhizobium capsulatum DSM 1112]